MTILITKQDTDITTNQFYRVEAANLGTRGNATNQLNTEKFIPVTFANAGNCLGIVVMLRSGITHKAAGFRDVQCELQELVASVWTTRASKTLTLNQIHDPNNTNPAGRWLVPFELTAPYAVNTTAGIWRFRFISTGSGSNDWFLCAQTAGTMVNPIYAAWCDTQLTPVSGSDQIIFKNYCDITTSFNFKGLLGAADSSYSYCAWVCRNLDATPANVCYARVPSSIASLVTIGIDGYFILSSHGGFRAGTQGSPIGADLLKINLNQVTAGNQISGFTDASAFGAGGSETARQYLLLYGVYPAKKQALATNARTVGATTIDVDDPSAFAVDDFILIGKRDGDTDEAGTPRHRITGISGNTLTFTPSLAGAASRVGARVIKTYNNATNNTGYGVSIRRVGGSTLYFMMSCFGSVSGWVMEGVFTELCCFSGSNNTSVVEDASYNLGYSFKDCFFLASSALNSYGGAYGNVLIGGSIPYSIINFENCIFARCGIFTGMVYNIVSSGNATITNFIATKMTFTNLQLMRIGANGVINGSLDFPQTGIQYIVQDIYIDSLGSGRTGFFLSGTSSYYDNIEIFGANGGGYNSGAFRMAGLVDSTVSNIKVNKAVTAMNFEGTNVNVTVTNLTLANEVANTVDFRANPKSFSKVVFKGVTGNPTFTAAEIQNLFSGSALAFENVNAANVDYTKTAFGEIYRTGTGLADTTVHTAGGYAVRFQSQVTSDNLTWVTKIPTGNIQSQTMVAGVWVNIANAAYYAGTHELPRMTISYDNGASEVYAEALAQTGWQFISVPFTPATTFGQVTITFSTNTDATTSNAYVYFDDFTAPLPQGANLNLGSMDLWSDALPVSPLNFATSISAADVWAADPTGFGANTVGDKVNKIKNETGLVPALL